MYTNILISVKMFHLCFLTLHQQLADCFSSDRSVLFPQSHAVSETQKGRKQKTRSGNQ